jgi:hypothetical protein
MQALYLARRASNPAAWVSHADAEAWTMLDGGHENPTSNYLPAVFHPACGWTRVPGFPEDGWRWERQRVTVRTM